MKLLGINILIVIISQLIGQIIPLYSIIGTSFVIPIVTMLMNFKWIYKIRIKISDKILENFEFKAVFVIISAFLSIIIDYFVAIHDSESAAWLLFFSFVTISVMSIGLVIIKIKTDIYAKKVTNIKTIINILEIIVLLSLPIIWGYLSDWGRENILYEIFRL
ncbi:MAG: hypothetical protein KAT68_15165 [Bacteroidales bacterium]|nr:hypothetical protein [Bacteroidales bacterium]